MRKLFRLLVLALLAPLIYSCVVEVFPSLFSDLDLQPVGLFFLGCACYTVIHGAILSIGGRLYYNLQFFRVLRHELSHAIMALSFGSYTQEMLVVNPIEKPGEPSYVLHHSPIGPGSLITLAPYCLPILTIPLLLLKLLPLSQFRHVVDFLIGLTLAFHYFSVMYEFGLRQ
jgi:hypothetical protein